MRLLVALVLALVIITPEVAAELNRASTSEILRVIDSGLTELCKDFGARYDDKKLRCVFPQEDFPIKTCPGHGEVYIFQTDKCIISYF